jgi:hypothetical protein
MLMILPIVFIVGFAFGYLTRARISRRRWAAAQKNTTKSIQKSDAIESIAPRERWWIDSGNLAGPPPSGSGDP